jgi:hypothetical protein
MAIENYEQDKVNAIRHLRNYISLLGQAMFSDLPQLAIMCAIQPTDFELLKKYDISKLPI